MSTSTAVNALAQDHTLDTYPVEVCYHNLTCKLHLNTTSNNCDGLSLPENRPYHCLASLETQSGSLVSKGCDAGNDYKLCCTDQPMCGVPLTKRKCGEVQGSGGLTACDNTTDDWGCPVDGTDCIYNAQAYELDSPFATRDVSTNISYMGYNYEVVCTDDSYWCPRGWTYDDTNGVEMCTPIDTPCYATYADPSVTCFSTEFTDAWLDDQIDFFNTAQPPDKDCFWYDVLPMPGACCYHDSFGPGSVELYQYQDVVIY